MSTSGGGGGGGGVGGALSLMGCVREASPPPQDNGNQGEFSVQPNFDNLQPKEPKKRRFHPLRGLRKIFRRKSRGAADINANSGVNDGNDHILLSSRDREEVTLRHPAGRPEESRSRSASELLTDSCDRESIDNTEFRREYRTTAAVSLNPYEANETVFLRRSGIEEAFAKLRGGPGQLSVSHDSVFPGEVPNTRPLSSLDPLAILERRPSKISENESKEASSIVQTQRHRISLQVLEQIKTVIEGRNQVSATDSNILQNRSSSKNVYHVEESQTKTTTTRSSSEYVAQIKPQQIKEDLPRLENEEASLNHRAAKHRITVRPKNRRPPKRVASHMGPSLNITTISEGFDTMDSLEITDSITDSPVESRNVTVIRKSSSRVTKNSEIFEELEAKLSSPSTISKSPDSLENSILSRTLNSPEMNEEQKLIKEIEPVKRKLSNRISKGSDIFAELSSKLPRRRSSVNRLSKSPDSLENTWSKSTDSFDRLDEMKDVKPAMRKSLNLVTKSIDRVSKSSDSLETLNTVNSDDSIERRKSSYEFRTVQKTSRAVSKSSENFSALEEIRKNETVVDSTKDDELQKGSSASDMINLTHDNTRDSRVMSKSSESIDELEINQLQLKTEPKRSSSDLSKRCWRQGKRTTVSSESSDNLEVDDELENRRARKPPRRIPSTSMVDIIKNDNAANSENDKKPPPVRKSSRFQKSSESSELGSTDTLDSDKKNKSSASTETLDSLERDIEQERKEEEMIDNVSEKRVKNEMWSSQTADSISPDIDETTAKPLITDKSYWRQSSDAKENIDIHQLLAITIVTHIAADNGNQRNSVLFPKKKLSSSQPTSPAKQEDNKIMFNNLLSSKNDEDLQNMLNGNLSEVSTDSKSFKEKLIMFEKLGK